MMVTDPSQVARIVEAGERVNFVDPKTGLTIGGAFNNLVGDIETVKSLSGSLKRYHNIVLKPMRVRTLRRLVTKMADSTVAR